MKTIAPMKIIDKLKPEEITTSVWREATVLHKHSDWEFTFTEDGTGTNFVNGVGYPAMLGTVYLLGPQHTHQQLSDKPITRRDICVSVEKMEQFANMISPNLYESLIANDKPITIKLTLNAFYELHERLFKADCLNPNEKYSILISFVMYLLGVYVENSSEKYIPKDILSFMQRVQNPNVFSQHINDIIGLSSYSHSHFIKLFKNSTGKTIIEYITDLRLSYAEKLLSDTDLSIITIASNVGYDTPSFFTQKFKKKYGVTPIKYRSSVREQA